MRQTSYLSGNLQPMNEPSLLNGSYHLVSFYFFVALSKLTTNFVVVVAVHLDYIVKPIEAKRFAIICIRINNSNRNIPKATGKDEEYIPDSIFRQRENQSGDRNSGRSERLSLLDERSVCKCPPPKWISRQCRVQPCRQGHRAKTLFSQWVPQVWHFVLLQPLGCCIYLFMYLFVVSILATGRCFIVVSFERCHFRFPEGFPMEIY